MSAKAAQSKQRPLDVSPQLALPLDVVTSTIIVYGGKGMGKTNFLSVVAEEVDASGQRFSILDPMGVCWGLRHAASGRGKGLEILILGGLRGDIPIEPTAGSVVADLVIDEEQVSAVIDISRQASGRSWSKGDKIRFVRDYSIRLYERQGERRQPLLQIIDEAARFIPQQVRANEDHIAECMGAIAQIGEEGRNIGLGILLVTQRSARLNKDVAELADSMIAFRTVGPRSMDAVMDWLGDHVPKERHKELSSQLRTLPVGSALVVSPGWLQFEGVVPMRARRTFDSSATPKIGEKRRTPAGKSPPPDLERYQALMAQTIERAKADDPKELKKRISALQRDIEHRHQQQARVVAEFERQIAGMADPGAARQKSASAYQDGVTAGFEQGKLETGRLLLPLLGRAKELAANARKTMASGLDLLTAVDELNVPPDLDRLQPETPTPRQTNSKPTSWPAAEPANPGNGALPEGERKILIAAAQYGSIARRSLSTLVGYKRSSRDAYIARLKSKGFIETNGGAVAATPAGVEALGSEYEPLPTGIKLQNWWRDRLPEGERKILEILLETGQPVARKSLSIRVDYKRSSLDAYIARLKARQLVITEAGGIVRAAKELF